MRSLRSLTFVLFALCAAVPATPASASPGGDSAGVAWSVPVPGRVVRAFQAPISRFGKGHLGADFATAPGTTVRAVGSGTVVFAGSVAGVLHVVIRHRDGRRTSYAFLATVAVRAGEGVARGAAIGTSGGTGENHDRGVFHLGLRVGDTFVDPMQLFGPVDLSGRVHLVPDGVSFESSGGPEIRAGERRALARAVRTTPGPILLPGPEDPSPLCDHLGVGAVPKASAARDRPG